MFAKWGLTRGSNIHHASDFVFNFATSANPVSFNGSNDGCIAVTVSPGNYKFIESPPRSLLSDGVFLAGDCSLGFAPGRFFAFEGTIAAGEIQTCAITNVVR
jgi:hypothetical protein